MFFQVYGANALIQWGMLLVVLAGLILWNEFARRTKMGGAITFFAIPVLLTVYFVAIAIGARAGAEWAVNNQTHIYMNGWFHYAKLYAALTGCIGFMMIKYKWGILSLWPPTSRVPRWDGINGGSAARACGSMAGGTTSSTALPVSSTSSV